MVNDEKILAALIAGGSVRAAAKIADVSATTIRSRLSDPVFRERYEAAKNTILTEACDAMCAKLQSATETLDEIMCDDTHPATVRVSAADSLLRHALRYVEAADFARRLDALEAQQKEGTG